MSLAVALASLALLAPFGPSRVAPDVIQRVVRQEFPAMRACYDEGLARNPKLAGRVAIRFSVGPTGRVLSADRHAATTLDDAKVVRCVASVFRKLVFPSPERRIEIIYPIEFVPG